MYNCASCEKPIDEPLTPNDWFCSIDCRVDYNMKNANETFRYIRTEMKFLLILSLVIFAGSMILISISFYWIFDVREDLNELKDRVYFSNENANDWHSDLRDDINKLCEMLEYRGCEIKTDEYKGVKIPV